MDSGYLDDHPSTSTPRGNTGLAPTALFAQLAQRQFDQQSQQPPQSRQSTMTQSEYDDPSSWTVRRRRSNRTNRSVDSRSSRGSYSDSEVDSEELRREWEEQVEQMKLMFQIIIFPFVGKFFGRKFGYFLFNRYKVLGTPFRSTFWTGVAAA